MTNLEKDLLVSLRKSLGESTSVPWSSGDLDKWRDWALRMKNVIGASCTTLDAMLKQPTEDGKK